MLELRQVVAGYGNIRALKSVDIKIPAGSVVSLIGANGAGKTTTMKAIMGLLPLEAGEISFQGKSLNKVPVHEIVRQGIALVPEGRSILARMTVLENLEMGAYQRRDKQEVILDIQHIFQRFPILEERRNQLGGTLSGGQQQMLAIGRALLSRPKLLLLDEPSMGLAPLVVADIFQVIREISQGGTTILLVEQNVRQALKIADYAYVMETGKIVLHGRADIIRHDPRVMEAYLGERAAS
ncbi:MAG: ABC transporter ATP-binding protein [Veillonellaceae bacterium]|jgi:branched-chain amino acid transport system ATP-binding protein|nr:ABC transporter ATP-binding protein [Veillonellaceae bacterium]